jgi:alpha-mannosidase
VYDGLNYFEDTEDSGDGYNHFPADNSLTLTTLEHKPTIERKGESIDIRYELRLPKSLAEGTKRRSEQLVECPLTVSVRLDDFSPLVRMETRFDNQAKDHRLRAVFSPDIETDYSLAEGQFDMLKRTVHTDPQDWILENPTGVFPQQNFVVIQDDHKGLILANKGLPEYEWRQGGGLFLTLMRGVEWINRLGWMNRKERMQPTYPSMFAGGAQCLGPNKYEYALIPFTGNWEDEVRDVYGYIVPLMTRETKGAPKGEKSFLSLEPARLILSAVKKCETRESLIVRFFNPTGRTVTGRVAACRTIREAALVKLNEERIREMPVSGNSVGLTIEPSQILSAELVFGR